MIILQKMQAAEEDMLVDLVIRHGFLNLRVQWKVNCNSDVLVIKLKSSNAGWSLEENK